MWSLHKTWNTCAGKLANAVREHSDLRFGLYYSLYEWFNPLYLHDKKSDYKNNEFVRFKTIPQLHELVTKC